MANRFPSETRLLTPADDIWISSSLTARATDPVMARRAGTGGIDWQLFLGPDGAGTPQHLRASVRPRAATPAATARSGPDTYIACHRAGHARSTQCYKYSTAADGPPPPRPTAGAVTGRRRRRRGHAPPGHRPPPRTRRVAADSAAPDLRSATRVSHPAAGGVVTPVSGADSRHSILNQPPANGAYKQQPLSHTIFDI